MSEVEQAVLKSLYHGAAGEADKLRAENERLRAALKEIADNPKWSGVGQMEIAKKALGSDSH